jgi:hypothetical protein
MYARAVDIYPAPTWAGQQPVCHRPFRAIAFRTISVKGLFPQRESL